MGRLCHHHGVQSALWADVRLYDRASLDRDRGAAFRHCDVLIDFSGPGATADFLDQLDQTPKPYVLGTTGHDPSILNRLSKMGTASPFLYAANFSITAAFLALFTQKMAKMAPNTLDIEITDRHHRHKKDAPSGTALMLADIIAAEKGWNRSAYCYDRTARIGARGDHEIGFAISRGGGVFGEHSVSFLGQDEGLTLSHQAFNRDVFAKGALRAAAFLASQKPGLYTMGDVLGLSL